MKGVFAGVGEFVVSLAGAPAGLTNENDRVLDGGIQAWNAAGLDLTTP